MLVKKAVIMQILSKDTSKISFWEYQGENLNKSANSIDPGKIVRKRRLAWLYTGGKR